MFDFRSSIDAVIFGAKLWLTKIAPKSVANRVYVELYIIFWTSKRVRVCLYILLRFACVYVWAYECFVKFHLASLTRETRACKKLKLRRPYYVYLQYNYRSLSINIYTPQRNQNKRVDKKTDETEESLLILGWL